MEPILENVTKVYEIGTYQQQRNLGPPRPSTRLKLYCHSKVDMGPWQRNDVLVIL